MTHCTLPELEAKIPSSSIESSPWIEETEYSVQAPQPLILFSSGTYIEVQWPTLSLLDWNDTYGVLAFFKPLEKHIGKEWKSHMFQIQYHSPPGTQLR
jgi:hypothetical protein